ncbi:hypothetical protein GQ651_07095 [Alphaproteobacteria bacterium GH1-50]|uniref:Uncharacterized protein n=1 Tax=Kangsaoukella pontilimi TaxID=2691042 RepID=A0A7C9IFW4_9RHOB|nr:hypothetical protein [Kangsaoukella pontilimi]MXQ07609.1 hypothetical protein [Kangsaoukella pontilimi]
MTNAKTLISLAVAASFAALPAMANGNDDPGVKGDLVQTSKEARQATGGPSGWGQQVSGKATGAIPSDDKNLGAFLDRMAPNPSPNK